jgi:hypothetical protein
MPEGDLIRIIPHRRVDDDCGSLEVWFANGRQSVLFYWDNLVSRRRWPIRIFVAPADVFGSHGVSGIVSQGFDFRICE